MANFTQTITNAISVFGPAPSNKWNAYNWNAFKWGEGTADLAASVAKFLTNSVSATNSVSLVADFNMSLSNAISTAEDMVSQELTDGEGYDHVFPGGVTNAEDRVSASWSQGSGSSPSWSQATASSTTWSQT